MFLFALISLAALPAQSMLPEKAEDATPLLIGESIPADQTLRTPDGQAASLTDVIKEKKTILIVYRGGWCPYCNAHLSEVGKVEEELRHLGYQIVAVSPDAPQELQATVDKNELGYQLFSDSKGEFIKALGIAFQAPQRYENLLVKSSLGDNPGLLPVPSLFIVDTQGLILFEYISPNYKQRIPAELLLAAARSFAEAK